MNNMNKIDHKNTPVLRYISLENRNTAKHAYKMSGRGAYYKAKYGGGRGGRGGGGGRGRGGG